MSADGEEKMIPEFLWLAFLVLAVMGLWFLPVRLKNRSNSPREAQSMDRDQGSLPESFFDPRTDPPKDFQK